MAYRPRPDDEYRKRSQEHSSGSEEFDSEIIRPWEGLRPKLAEYSDVYGYDTTTEDLEFVRERHTQWRAKPRTSMRLEYALMDGMYSRNWLGERTQIFPASEFDDVANGIDMVLRLESEDGKVIFLGIDVTTSEDSGILEEKIIRTYEALQRGQTAKVKYFTSEDDGIHGLVRLPRVVIGTNHESTERIFQAFVAGLENHAAMGAVDEDPLQYALINQMKKQLALDTEAALEGFLKAAKRIRAGGGKYSAEYLEALTPLLTTVQGMELESELSSPAWKTLLQELEAYRGAMEQDNKYLAEGVFMHLTAIEELEAIAKEKSSHKGHTVGADRASHQHLVESFLGEPVGEETNPTERLLEIPRKNIIRSHHAQAA